MNARCHFSFFEFIQIPFEFTAEDLSWFFDSVYLPALSGELKRKLDFLFSAERLEIHAYNSKISFRQSFWTENSEINVMMGPHVKLESKVGELVRGDIFIGECSSGVAIFIVGKFGEYHFLVALADKAMILGVEAIEYLW